jgi:hypothetical protein
MRHAAHAAIRSSPVTHRVLARRVDTVVNHKMHVN